MEREFARRVGSTTRTIDEAIQLLFRRGYILIPEYSLKYEDIRKVCHRYGRHAENELIIDDAVFFADFHNVQYDLVNRILCRMSAEHGNIVNKSRTNKCILLELKFF